MNASDFSNATITNELTAGVSLSAQFVAAPHADTLDLSPTSAGGLALAAFDAFAWDFYHHNSGVRVFSWHWLFISVSFHLSDLHGLFVTLFGADPTPAA